ncbi:MAG: hypothetical protein DRP74_00185 [Candidatus Omnitrophota bacterium]|nr:MAG: hypothetical protein DRP74_00185 [Candidatus Omnitrophota bacterium]
MEDINPQKLIEFMNSITDGFLLFDRNLKLIGINRAALKQWNLRKQSALGKHILELSISPGSKEVRYRYRRYKQVLKTGKPFIIDNAVLCPEVGERHAFLRAFRVGDGLAIIGTDITERKKTERLLRDNEKKYRLLAANTLDVIYTVDLNFNITFINEAVFRLLGYKREEIEGVNVNKIATPASIKILKKAARGLFYEARKGKIRQAQVEVQYIHKDRHLIDCETVASPIISEEGKIIGFQGRVTNITERKKIEKALKLERLRLREYFENLPICAYNISFDGKIIDCNKLAVKTLGYKDKSQLAGKSFITIYASSSQKKAKRLFRLWKKKHKIKDEELQVITKQGKILDVLLNVNTIYGLGGKPLYSISTHLDITRRKEAELALKASEEKFKEIVSKIPGVVYQTLVKETGEHVFLFVSDNAYKIFGNRPQMLYKDHSLAFKNILSEDKIGLNNLIIKSLKTLKPYEAEFRIMTKAGQLKWVYATSTPRKFPGGGVVFNGIVFDITQRKQVEEAFKESELRLRQVAENIKESFWISEGVNKKPLYLSPAYEKIWGCSRQTMFKDPQAWIKAVVKEDRPKLIACVDRLAKGDFSEQNFPDFRVVHPDGSLHWVAARVYPIRNKKGQIFRVAGFAEDITERKKAEEIIRQSEEKYRSVVNNIKVGIYRNTPGTKGRFLQANSAIAKIFGYDSLQEFMGVRVIDLYPDPKQRKKVVEEIAKKSSVRNLEIELRKKDGSPVWVSISASVQRDKKGQIKWIDGILEDISEIKHLEQAKANLIRNISHGLNTPLALSQMSYQILQEGIAENNMDLIKKAYAIGKTSLDKLGKDTKNIMDVFSLELRKLTKRGKRKISLEKVVKKIVLNLADLTQSRKNIIRVDIGKGADKVIMAVRDLSFLLGNLIENAVKFTENGRIYISSRRIQDRVRITVKDTGYGFSPIDKDKLFTKFYKQHPAIAGEGVGLAICKEIVDSYKGSIKLFSRGQDQGASVVVELPLK